MMNDFWNKAGLISHKHPTYDRRISTGISDDSNYTIVYRSCEDFGPNVLHATTSVLQKLLLTYRSKRPIWIFCTAGTHLQLHSNIPCYLSIG